MEIKRSILLNPYRTKLLRMTFRNNPTCEEKKLWGEIRNKKILGIKFRRQYGIGPYVVDFYSTSLKLIIEIDGLIHQQADQREHDQIREEFLIQNQFNIIRFPNYEVNNDIESVIEKIKVEIAILSL